MHAEAAFMVNIYWLALKVPLSQENNDLGPEGARALIRGLEKMTCMQTLHLVSKARFGALRPTAHCPPVPASLSSWRSADTAGDALAAALLILRTKGF